MKGRPARCLSVHLGRRATSFCVLVRERGRRLGVAFAYFELAFECGSEADESLN